MAKMHSAIVRKNTNFNLFSVDVLATAEHCFIWPLVNKASAVATASILN